MTVNFNEAHAGQQAFVFRCPPGDEHGWVTDPEWWNDIDDPVRTKRQRWMLLSEDDVVFHPRHELCPACGGDDTRCDFCDSTGTHPLAGQMEILNGDNDE